MLDIFLKGGQYWFNIFGYVYLLKQHLSKHLMDISINKY